MLFIVLLLDKIKSNMATNQEIELASLNATPGILPTHTKFESYIGENVINLSNVQLSETKSGPWKKVSHSAQHQGTLINLEFGMTLKNFIGD